MTIEHIEDRFRTLGPYPQEKLIRDLKTTVDDINARIDAINDATSLIVNRSKFSAGGAAAIINANDTVIFSDVRVNVGNHYNPVNGLFTVPVSGIYEFFCQLLSNNTTQLEARLVVNGVINAAAATHISIATGMTDNWGQGVLHGMLTLTAGDIVKIISQTVGGVYPDSASAYHYNWFMGSQIA